MDLGPLGELVGVAPAGELVGVDEAVLAAVDLGAAGRPRRARDRERELREAAHEALDQGALPCPGRSGDDEDDPMAVEREVGTHA